MPLIYSTFNFFFALGPWIASLPSPLSFWSLLMQAKKNTVYLRQEMVADSCLEWIKGKTLATTALRNYGQAEIKRKVLFKQANNMRPLAHYHKQNTSRNQRACCQIHSLICYRYVGSWEVRSVIGIECKRWPTRCCGSCYFFVMPPITIS